VIVRDDGGSNQTVVAWTLTSDARAKTEIRPAEEEAGLLERLRALRVWRYGLRHLPERGRAFYGFVAQQVQPLLPDLVESVRAGAEEEDDLLGLRQGEITPLHHLWLQRLQDQVDALQAHIGAKLPI
jgi:hypothetical protein